MQLSKAWMFVPLALIAWLYWHTLSMLLLWGFWIPTISPIRCAAHVPVYRQMWKLKILNCTSNGNRLPTFTLYWLLCGFLWASGFTSSCENLPLAIAKVSSAQRLSAPEIHIHTKVLNALGIQLEGEAWPCVNEQIDLTCRVVNSWKPSVPASSETKQVSASSFSM